jgi:hypothetical protein
MGRAKKSYRNMFIDKYSEGLNFINIVPSDNVFRFMRFNTSKEKMNCDSTLHFC